MKKLRNKVHRNLPQLRAFLVSAQITVILFARATGKTFGVTAPWIYLRAKVLVQSTGFVCSPTYTHLKDTVIPELQKGWKNLGLVKGKHYWLYELPPPELGIPEQHTPIDKPKYFIFWLNGSVTKLVSLDHGALVNSKSFDYGAVVEARKCNKERVYDDLIPTVRGDRDRIINHYDKTGKITHTTKFQDYPEHHSWLFESDLPKIKSERWILDFKKEQDPQTVKEILQLMRIKQKLRKGAKKALKQINEALNQMRRGLTYVAKASTLDNIHVLGVSTIKNFRKNLTPRDYDISILGIEQEEVEGNFYSALARDKHGYSGINFNKVDKLDWSVKRNWKWHSDLKGSELYISFDCNAIHNCIAVFQKNGRRIKLVSYHWLESEPGNPKTHKDVTKEFCEYYKGSCVSKVNIIYNHTMIAGAKAGLDTKVDDIVKVISSKDFNYTTRRLYVGQASTHEDIYDNWSKLLKGDEEYEFSYNLQTCDVWYEACKDTPLKIVDGRRGQQIKKNKSSESINSGIEPHKATHATEAGDTFVQWLYQHKGGTRDISSIASA